MTKIRLERKICNKSTIIDPNILILICLTLNLRNSCKTSDLSYIFLSGHVDIGRYLVFRKSSLVPNVRWYSNIRVLLMTFVIKYLFIHNGCHTGTGNSGVRKWLIKKRVASAGREFIRVCKGTDGEKNTVIFNS